MGEGRDRTQPPQDSLAHLHLDSELTDRRLSDPRLVASLRAVSLTAALIGVAACGAGPPPPPDESLGQMVAQFVFDSLGSDSPSPGLIWIADDSATWRAFKGAVVGRHDSIEPPSAEPITCPGSTDANRRQVRGRLGYRLSLKTYTNDLQGLQVDASVRCQFLYEGKVHRRAFSEGRTWSARKTRRGWQLLRVVGHYIT